MAVPKSHALNSRASGFTLVELMIALTIVAILVGLAAPSYRDFTHNNQTSATNNDLVTALNLARNESLRRGTGVTVCPSPDGVVCSNAGDWPKGWIVFQDDAQNGVIAADKYVVQKWSAPQGGILVATTSQNIQYQPTGMVTNAAKFDVSYPACRGQNHRQIQVSPVGTISTQLQACP
jgi:type IV fimbrial biogenesis protein FimT